MNRLILEILPQIEQVVRNTTSNNDFRHELTQMLVLKCYDNEILVKSIPTPTERLSWLYLVKRNLIVDLKRRDKYVSLSVDLPQEPKEELPINKIKTLSEMINVLNAEDRMCIELYLECEMNISDMNRRTTVSRKALTERVNEILDKWKHLDIYL